VTPTGLEHQQKPAGKPQISNPGGTESGTAAAELAQIVALWLQIPATARTAMLALAKATARDA